MTCEKCHAVVEIGSWPFCPHGRHGRFAVISDAIVGGARMFENLGHEPVWIETKSQLRHELAARGLREHVRHVGEQGSDKAKATTRWI